MVKLKELKGIDKLIDVFIVTLNDGNAYYQSDKKASPDRGDAKVFTNLTAAEKIAEKHAGVLARVEKV